MVSRVKNSSFRLWVFRLIEWVWCLLKKVIIRFFYFSSRIVIEIKLIVVSWIIFFGVMVRILLRMMVWIFIDVGFSDIINSLILKKEEKISLIMVFFFSCECCCKNSMLFVVRLLERNVLSVKGRLSI